MQAGEGLSPAGIVVLLLSIMATPIKPTNDKAEIGCLLECLSRVMEPSLVDRWLKQPNPAFDGSTPLQIIERGEIDRIKRLVHDLESGQPG